MLILFLFKPVYYLTDRLSLLNVMWVELGSIFSRLH